MPKMYNLLSLEIAEYIEQYIDNNNLRPGDKLPPERELAATLNVTRVTLRHGLQMLIDNGTIINQRNNGYFVCPPKVKRELINYCFPNLDSLLKKYHYTTSNIDFIPYRISNICKNALRITNISDLYSNKFIETVDNIPIGLSFTMQKKKSLKKFPNLFIDNIPNHDLVVTQSLRIYQPLEDEKKQLELLALNEADSLLMICNFIYFNEEIIAVSISLCVGTRVDLISDISLKI